MLERTILVDGFSKAYAMTGWRPRLGPLSPALAPHAVRLVINSNTCNRFVRAGGRDCRTARAAGRGRCDGGPVPHARDAIVARLARIRAFAVTSGRSVLRFPDVRALPLSAAALADRLLQEEAVALLDGADSVPVWIRIPRLSFATSLESLEKPRPVPSLVARL